MLRSQDLQLAEELSSVSTFHSFTPQSTVIRDSRALALAMVKFLPDNEIDTYKSMLQTMREHPDTRALAIKRLSGEMSSSKLSESLISAHNSNSFDAHTHTHTAVDANNNNNNTVNSTVTQTAGKAHTHSHTPKNKTLWVDQWLLKALGNKRVNLFPLRLPSYLRTSRAASALPLDPQQQVLLENEQKLLREKAKLAAYLFSNKQIIQSSFKEFLLAAEPFNPYPEDEPRHISHRVSTYASTSSHFRPVQPNKEEEMVYIEASKIADEIGDELHTDKLRKLCQLVKLHMQGELSHDELLTSLAEHFSLHMDKLQPLMDFLGVPLSETAQKLIKSRKLRRERTVEELHAEISYVVFQHNAATSAPHQTHSHSQDSAFDALAAVGNAALDAHSLSSPSTLSTENNIHSHTHTDTARRNKYSFGTTHLFEVNMRCFPKLQASKFAVDANAHLHFQSSIKSVLAAHHKRERDMHGPHSHSRTPFASLDDDVDYDLLVNSVRSNEIDDLELAHATQTDSAQASQTNHQTPFSEEEIITNSFASPLRKILIDNLPRDVTVEHIRDALRKCGPVKKVFLYTPSTELPVNHAVLQEVNVTPDQIVESPDKSLLDTLMISSRSRRGESKAQDNEEKEEQIAITVVAEEHDHDHEHEHEHEHEHIEEENEKKEEEEKKKKKKSVPSKNLKRKLNRDQVLKGSRTDNYAFVVMEDEKGFEKVCCDAIRIFGININGQLCKTYKVDNYKNFRVEVVEPVAIRDLKQALSVALDGQFECYNLNSRMAENLRPLYINLTFNDHADAWKAFHIIERSANKDDFSFLAPTWIRSQRYYKMGMRAKNAIEQDYNNREIDELYVERKPASSSSSASSHTENSEHSREEEDNDENDEDFDEFGEEEEQDRKQVSV